MPKRIQPSSRCCCCTPLLCGLRAGVLTLAVLETIGGAVAFLDGMSAGIPWHQVIESLMPYTNVPEERLPSHHPVYVVYVAYLNIPLGLIGLATGIIGIKATSPLQDVMALSPQVLMYARLYFLLSVAGTCVTVLLSFLVATWFQVAVSNTTGLGPGDSSAIWAFALFAMSGSCYFLFVIWSYHAKLQMAGAGDSRAEHGIIKGVTSLGVVPFHDCAPLPEAPPAEQQAEGHLPPLNAAGSPPGARAGHLPPLNPAGNPPAARAGFYQ